MASNNATVHVAASELARIVFHCAHTDGEVSFRIPRETGEPLHVYVTGTASEFIDAAQQLTRAARDIYTSTRKETS